MRLEQQRLLEMKGYVCSWILELTENESIINRKIEISSVKIKTKLHQIVWVLENHKSTLSNIHIDLLQTKYLDFMIQNKHIQLFRSQYPKIQINQPKIDLISYAIHDTFANDKQDLYQVLLICVNQKQLSKQKTLDETVVLIFFCVIFFWGGL